MSDLRQAVQQYLALRRSLGFKLRLTGNYLHDFVTFMERERATHIATELALRWATQPVRAQPATWGLRLGVVRRFASWCSATDPRTEIPPPGLLGHRYRRRPPYIYSDKEIETLLRAAGQLPSPKGLRAVTYSTLFALLVVTGMRVNEALRLQEEDVNIQDGVLRIRVTKFAKSRIVPVHQSTCAALAAYTKVRDRIFPRRSSRAFFISERATPITEWAAQYTFAKLSQQVGLRTPVKGRGRGPGPRIHDLRHRFAAGTLIRWYRSGLDVEREIPKLATYLGHVHLNDTYWYLEAVPELLQLATERLEQGRCDKEKEVTS